MLDRITSLGTILCACLLFCGTIGCSDSATDVPEIEGNNDDAAGIGSKEDAKESLLQMRKIAMAILNHESAKRKMPARYSTTSEGKPGLSWRVAILPFLGEVELWKKFNQDEPWDSEQNIKLLAEMPAVYRSPMIKGDSSKTVYLAVQHEKAGLRDERGIRIASITDGTSNTLAIVEVDAKKAVEWTRPEDLPLPTSENLKGLGGLHPDQAFLAAFLDGHVQFLDTRVGLENFTKMVTASGDEYLKPTDLEAKPYR